MKLLEIIINTNTFFLWLAIIVLFLAYWVYKIFIEFEKYKNNIHLLDVEKTKRDGIISEQITEISKIKAEMRGQAHDIAVKIFGEWKDRELKDYIKVIEKAEVEKAQSLLNQWKIDNDLKIRKDAANRSVRNVLGKVTEHLIPFSESMKNFNPKDIRFIGSPIDLIVFDGAEELKKDELFIYFVEVKTGTSTLSKRQKMIMEAVKNKKVDWIMVDIRDFGEGVNSALSE